MTILDEIVESVREGLKAKKRAFPIDALKQKALKADAPRDFRAALTDADKKVRIIAEIKRASPSKGVIREDLVPAEIAKIYDASGASAMSVLTEEKYFQGSIEDLKSARSACALPVLRKDFIIDEYQIYEARAAGADAILLIAACLDQKALKEFRELAESFNMTALVETHNEEELEIALGSGASVIGINNRDLKTFKTDIQTTIGLMNKAQDNAVIVTESGISSPEHITRLLDAGVDAFLIGESLVKADDPGRKLSELMAASQ